MDVYSFIASILFILVETRAVAYENVELKFGKNTIIIPLKNPVHVTQINGLNFADLNLPIPNLVELILQSRALPTLPPPPLRRSLPPDRSTEDDSEPHSQPDPDYNLPHMTKSSARDNITEQSSLDNEENNEPDSYKNEPQPSNTRNENQSIEQIDTSDDQNSVNLTNRKTEEEILPITSTTPAPEDVTLHSMPKYTENPINSTYTSEEDEFSSDLISEFSEDEENHTQAETEKAITSQHTDAIIKDKVPSHSTKVPEAASPNLEEDAVTKLPETTVIINKDIFTIDNSPLSYEEAKPSHYTPKLDETSFPTTIENDGKMTDNITKLASNSHQTPTLQKDITSDDTSISEGEITERYEDTSQTTVPVKKFITSTHSPARHDDISGDQVAVSSAQYIPDDSALLASSDMIVRYTPSASSEDLDTKTDAPETSTRPPYKTSSYSSYSHHVDTDAPDTTSPLVRTTTISPLSTDSPIEDRTEILLISTQAKDASTEARKMSSFSPVSSTLRTTGSPKQDTSTTPASSSSVTIRATKASQVPLLAQNANGTRSTTKATSNSPSPVMKTATTAAPSLSRNATVTTPKPPTRPQPKTTTVKKKGVAKARRKPHRLPCQKHRKNKGSGHKGKPVPGGRRRRRKTTPAARRTTRRPNTPSTRATTKRPSSMGSTTLSSSSQGSTNSSSNNTNVNATNPSSTTPRYTTLPGA